MADKRELLHRFNSLKSEISRLKGESGSVGLRKRELYRKSGELKEAFYAVIEKIKGIRSKRDQHTASVKELKSKRDSAASAAKTSADDLTKLKGEKEKMASKLGVKRPASAISSEIERLEFKIETEALPFEKEKKLNKVIKEKKEELKKAEQLSDLAAGLKSSFQSFHSYKRESDESHRELQLHASVSQKAHEEMLSFSKKADELKSRLSSFEKELKEVVSRHAGLKSQLQQKLSELAGVSRELDKISAEEVKKRQEEREKFIEAKEKELTEKMKSGKKLTRDDLIMLQKE